MMMSPDAPLLCPLARTFAASPAESACRGASCACWRWERVTTDHPLWRAAVRGVADASGEKSPFAKAAAHVAANKEDFGLVPTRGYCGLAVTP